MHFDKTVRRTAVGLAFALACSTPFGAHAASDSGQYAVKGIGIQKCADFTEAYEKRTQGAFVFAGWVDGYISAYNRAHPGTFDAAPWQSVDVLLALIHNHCSKAPEERLFGVVHAMIEFFKEQELAESSPTIETAAGDQKITIYKEVLRRAQEKLVEAGVYKGTPDGLFGPKTQAAFETYQEKNKLPKTGLPDQQTLVNLFGLKPPE
jgi:Putative peptidoglycan binding domain